MAERSREIRKINRKMILDPSSLLRQMVMGIVVFLIKKDFKILILLTNISIYTYQLF